MAQIHKDIIEILYNKKFPPKVVKCDLLDLISKQLGYPRNIARKGILDGNLLINNDVCKNPEVRINDKSIVKFQNVKIEVPQIESTSKFDEFIKLILEKCFDFDHIEKLYDDQKNTLTALCLEYFHVFGYNVDELSDSLYANQILELLEEVYKSRLETDRSIKKLKRRDIVEILLSIRESEYIRVEESCDRIINGFFDLNSSMVFNEIGKIINSRPYKTLIRPLLYGMIDPILVISHLKKEYSSILAGGSKDLMITKNIEIQKNYKKIELEIKALPNKRIAGCLLKVTEFYKRKCDEYVGFTDTGEPNLIVSPENRTYNFNEEKLSIQIIIKNSGSGIARNIRIENTTNEQYIIKNQDVIDIIAPEETRATKFLIENIAKSITNDNELNICFTLFWENDFGKGFQKSDSLITLLKQKEDLPWEELFYSKPYNKRAIDDPTKLFGREKLLYDLQRNIEKSTSITSTIIYGQKRVGKSSIVKTLNKIYENTSSIIFVYKSIGDLKNVESVKTLQRVGETIYKTIINEFRKKNPELIQHIKDLDEPSFLGSLAPLKELISDLTVLNHKLRFIVCLDEFDELNQEFFENSELGKTFALNLGKGINDLDNVGFILVGSENMTHKAKNGMRLNTYEQKRVDTFNKATEYESFCKLISEPTKSCLKFSPDVFKIIFELTNGNPYFTNLIMAKIFNEAYQKKISFVDKEFVKDPIENFINVALTNNDFAHFLEDGLSEDPVKHEIGLDRRRRLLTALVLAKKEKNNPKWSDIKRKIKYPRKFVLSETQFEDTLKEFIQRGIIKEDSDGVQTIIPPLYEKWLLGTGVYQIIADLEDKDEILEKLYKENKLFITDEDYFVLLTQIEEVASKSKLSEVKTFVEQFDDNEDRRRIVEFLKNTVVITSQEAISHIKKTFSKIWSTITLGMGERPIIKNAEIICFPDSFIQNQNFAEIIKDSFLFAKAKTIKTVKDLNNIDASTEHLIIYEPLIDCPYYYKNELSKILKLINPIHVRTLKIHIICFIITDEAKTALIDLFTKNFHYEYEIHDYKTFQRKEISPFYNNDDTINNITWNLITQKYPRTHNKSTSVKIGELVPYQSFPVLWSSELSRHNPLFPSSVPLKNYSNRYNISDNLENSWNFKSETNKIEFKASLATPARNWKEINQLTEKYKGLSQEKILELDLGKRLSDAWLMKAEKKEYEKIRAAIKHSIMKTIAGFSNSEGGKLYVGIEDDQTVQGIIYDQEFYSSEEEIRKVFDSMVSNYLGPEYSGKFEVNFIELQNGANLLEIIVEKSETEVWIRRNKEGSLLPHGKEEFFIRGLQETNQLSAREFAEWREKRRNN